MSDGTHIEWTEATWNPVTGCSVLSPGCTNCYAMKLAGTRLRDHPSRAGLTRDSKAGPVWTGKVRFNEQWLDQPLRWRRPRMIFVCAHGDLFHEDVPDEWIDRVFAVMALCPQHTFQVLTKRSARMRGYCADPETPFRVARAIAALSGRPHGPEEVQPVEGFPGYFVSSHGHVYSERRGKRKRLTPDAGEQGHMRVPLFREAGPRRGERMLVHRLVLSAFDGPPPFDDAQGRHLDGDPTNNAIGNLTWGGQSANWDDSKRHGSFRRYSKLTEEQVTEIKNMSALGATAEGLARRFPVSATQIRNIVAGRQWNVAAPIDWPLSNVWKGVSVEDQARADERIPDLLATPAAIRWLSCEPLLGPLTILREWRGLNHRFSAQADDPHICCCGRAKEFHVGIDWIVAGGESGPGARPMHPDWARSLRDQCAAAGVPFFFKQWGAWGHGKQVGEDNEGLMRAQRDYVHHGALSKVHIFSDGIQVGLVGKKSAGRLLDGVTHDAMPELKGRALR